MLRRGKAGGELGKACWTHFQPLLGLLLPCLKHRFKSFKSVKYQTGWDHPHIPLESRAKGSHKRIIICFANSTCKFHPQTNTFTSTEPLLTEKKDNPVLNLGFWDCFGKMLIMPMDSQIQQHQGSAQLQCAQSRMQGMIRADRSPG